MNEILKKHLFCIYSIWMGFGFFAPLHAIDHIVNLLCYRWTINLALKTIGKMLYASNPMGSEDFSEADPKAMCAYLCFFFMSSFKVRQSKAVIRRLVSRLLEISCKNV